MNNDIDIGGVGDVVVVDFDIGLDLGHDFHGVDVGLGLDLDLDIGVGLYVVNVDVGVYGDLGLDPDFNLDFDCGDDV